MLRYEDQTAILTSLKRELGLGRRLGKRFGVHVS
jgi:hypothetical protein